MKYRIYCEPRPWPRTEGNGRRRYSPPWYARLKGEIRNQICSMDGVERFDDTFIRVYITVILPTPRRKPKYPYPSMGDVDNFAKAVLDSLQRDTKHHPKTGYWIFNDDRFVQSLYVAKRYAEPDEQPGYLIEVERV